MAKIYPNNPSISTSCEDNSSERKTFTVWMKSLVFHGNGCTIFSSKGDVVYRVDNYQKRRSREVFLMDYSGKVLFSVNRKKFRLFGCWEGFKWSGNAKVNKERPWFFQVRKNHTILSKATSCRVALKRNENARNAGYNIIGLEGKSTLKIVDFSGRLMAEAVQKQSSEGVCLGEDVLTLSVEANADESLIMALVTVYGLIYNKL